MWKENGAISLHIGTTAHQYIYMNTISMAMTMKIKRQWIFHSLLVGHAQCTHAIPYYTIPYCIRTYVYWMNQTVKSNLQALRNASISIQIEFHFFVLQLLACHSCFICCIYIVAQRNEHLNSVHCTLNAVTNSMHALSFSTHMLENVRRKTTNRMDERVGKWKSRTRTTTTTTKLYERKKEMRKVINCNLCSWVQRRSFFNSWTEAHKTLTLFA